MFSLLPEAPRVLCLAFAPTVTANTHVVETQVCSWGKPGKVKTETEHQE